MPARSLVLVLLVALAACGDPAGRPSAEPAFPSEVTPALTALLFEVDELSIDEVRERAIALEASEPDTLDALIAVLRVEHPTRQQRGRALVVIESLGPGTVPSLLRFFLTSREQVAERAYVAIRHVLPAASSWIAAEPFPFDRQWTDAHQLALKPFEGPLIERARRGSANERRYAVLILASLPPSARTMASISVLTDAVLHDDDATVNDAACALMASAHIADDAVPRLLRMLDSADENARDLALSILERIGHHAKAVSMAFLERAKATDDEELKCSLLVSVSSMGSRGVDAVPLLQDEMMSGDPERMRSAANCLVAIGRESVEGLAFVMRSGTLSARVLAARTMGRLGQNVTPYGRAALDALVDDEDPDLAAAAQAALEQLGPR